MIVKFLCLFKDISKFCVILFIFLLAFIISLNNLFCYYQSSVRANLEMTTHSKTNAEVNFGDITSTFFTVFWAMFGLGSADHILLSPFKNGATEIFGKLIYLFYHITFIIILLNMLVAAMTQSYEKILVRFSKKYLNF